MKNRYIEISKSRLSQFEENIPWQKINQVIEFGSSYGNTLEDIGIKNKLISKSIVNNLRMEIYFYFLIRLSIY